MVSKIYCFKKSLHFHLLLGCLCHGFASSKVVVCHEGIIGPLREHPFVKIHENGILLCDLSIEDALHVPVCAQTILDVSSSSCLCPQLHWLEPVHVLPVEEHNLTVQTRLLMWKACPDRTVRLTTTLLGSAESNEPVASNDCRPSGNSWNTRTDAGGKQIGAKVVMTI